MARDVVRAVRAERPDLLHTHLVHADIYGSIASRLRRVPFVSSRHNDDRYLLGPFRYVDRAFARPARRLDRDLGRRAPLPRAGGPAPEKLVTVRYGLDELPADARRDRRPPTPASRPRPLAPRGRPPDRAEGPRDAAARLRAGARASIPEARLAILGSGPLEAETRALVGELGLDDAVLLPGPARRSRDWLERADVFVHTSRWEGFGIVLLEAMLAGPPVVATRVSAVPEVVVGRRDGAPRRGRGRCRRVGAALEDAARRPGAGAGARRGRQRAGTRASSRSPGWRSGR